MQSSKLQSKVQNFSKENLKKLYIPPPNSHKGQNGKLLIIAGSELFHAPLLWTLKVASRIVDMVFFSSTIKNNEIAKEEFRDGIIVPRNKVEDYIKEAECILIGPGLPRKDGEQKGDDDTKSLTETLLKKYPKKKWVIDGGSLQVLDPEILLLLKKPILTPHIREFQFLELKIQNAKFKIAISHFAEASRDKQKSKLEERVELFAQHYRCTVLFKGPVDIVCGLDNSVRPPTLTLRRVEGGNAGMTKGGTGDVLAGLVAGLYCKNDDPFLVAQFASYINKKAGENLFKKVGYYFNASDLADEIPKVMQEILI